MSSPLAEATRKHLAGLAQANAFEIQELRNASAELKLRQLWALMTCADVQESAAEREAESHKIRHRWDRYYEAQNV